jgi:transposase
MLQFKIKKSPASPAVFSESFKRRVVREFEKGGVTKDFLRIKYAISGNSRILEWCRKYGKFVYPCASDSIIMKDPQKQRIKELEEKLKYAELKLKVYDKLIEVTNRELSTDIVKKIEAELSKSWPQSKK